MRKILIVDDAVFMRTTLSTILEKEKYVIVGQAANGKEGVRLYKSEQPDLVTMDITMPVMNGIEAIQEIIAYDPAAKIVVCSAMGQQKVVVEAIEKGAKDFIVKPFDASLIIDTVNHVLSED